MYNWIASFKKTTAQSKLFFLMIFIFGLPLLATTIFCYDRIQGIRAQKIESIERD